MKLAIVHDWFLERGGADRVLIEMHRMYPTAPIYLLFGDKKLISRELPNAEVRTSYLQKIPLISKIYRFLFLFLPSVIESFDLSGFDRVISSSPILSKSLVLRPGTKHICYCYSPTRQLWDQNAEYNNRTNESWTKKIAQHLMRIWDYFASERPDELIAISKSIARRIEKYYHKPAKVIYPPLTLQPQNPVRMNELGDYYLLVARLREFKNIESVVTAFDKMKRKLVVIGEGPQLNHYRRMKIPHINFIGHVSDSKLIEFYRHCRALIVANEEDFGLTAVEAMACGRPVIALRKGGAIEIVQENVTGMFFDDPIAETIADAVLRFEEIRDNFNPDEIKNYSKKYSVQKFRTEIKKALV